MGVINRTLQAVRPRRTVAAIVTVVGLSLIAIPATSAGALVTCGDACGGGGGTPVTAQSETSLSAQPDATTGNFDAVSGTSTEEDLLDASGDIVASQTTSGSSSPSPTSNPCYIKTSPGSRLQSFAPLPLKSSDSNQETHWYTEVYVLNDARYVGGEYTQQWDSCGAGGASPKDYTKLYFAGIAESVELTNNLANWGVWYSGVVSGSGTTVTIGASADLGTDVGADAAGQTASDTSDAAGSLLSDSELPTVSESSSGNASIGASVNVGVTTATGAGSDTGDYQADGQFPDYPSQWAKYNLNRANSYYIAPSNFAWDGSTAFEGNVLHSLYEWPMGWDNSPVFTYVAGTKTFCSGLCEIEQL